jgi:hypothetical protein
VPQSRSIHQPRFRLVLMLVDADAIRNMRRRMLRDDRGPYSWGAFNQLWAALMLEHAQGRTERNDLFREVTAASNRLRDALTIAFKLDWMIHSRDEGAIEPELWMYFATSDINGFFSNVRSLFDHVARALRISALKRDSVPRSFYDLRKWVAKDPPRADAQLGVAAARIVAGCDWFEELRDIRDGITHRDSMTLVFPSQPSIDFQVYDAGQRVHCPLKS